VVTTASAVPMRGDEEALFRCYNDRLLRAVASVADAPHAVVEDACAFAWLQLVRRQPRRDTAYPWLRQVAVREAWRLARRERRDAHLEEVSGDIDEPWAPVDTLTAVEARAALAVLAELPDRQRRYLTLLIAGYRYADIARLSDATYTNVNKHLAGARATIRSLHSA